MRLQKRIEEIGEHLRRFAAEEEILTAAGLGRWERVFARLDAMDRELAALRQELARLQGSTAPTDAVDPGGA